MPPNPLCACCGAGPCPNTYSGGFYDDFLTQPDGSLWVPSSIREVVVGPDILDIYPVLRWEGGTYVAYPTSFPYPDDPGYAVHWCRTRRYWNNTVEQNAGNDWIVGADNLPQNVIVDARTLLGDVTYSGTGSRSSEVGIYTHPFSNILGIGFRASIGASVFDRYIIAHLKSPFGTPLYQEFIPDGGGGNRPPTTGMLLRTTMEHLPPQVGQVQLGVRTNWYVYESGETPDAGDTPDLTHDRYGFTPAILERERCGWYQRLELIAYGWGIGPGAASETFAKLWVDSHDVQVVPS